MFFSGALGALFMYSILHSRDGHRHRSHGRQAYEQRLEEEETAHRSIQEKVVQEYARQAQKPHIERLQRQDALPKSIQPQPVYIPRGVIREVIVDCSCKCACKEPEKPESPRIFWSLDQGNFLRAAGGKEAKKTQEKRREEVAGMMKYWSLDQGMHADVKGRA